MLSNKNWCTGSCLALLAFVCGCSSHKAEKGPENTAPITVASTVTTPAAPELTATEAATQAADDASADAPTTTVIDNTSGLLNSTAPKDYVVRRGDTLWGIANTFLKDPWLWPEIWYVNSQVRNPHLIYPGDTLHLAYGANGQPQLQLERGSAARLHPQLHSEDSGAIAGIPYDAIASFFSKPGVLSKAEAEHSPYVLALLNDHQIAGRGHEIYVKNLHAGVGERFLVMHVDQPLNDTQSHRKLGYLAVYAGTAQVERAGETALAVLTDSGREVIRGDVLIPDTTTVLKGLVPHAPTQAIDGRVLAVVNGVLVAGQWEVVAINRGSRDGLEPGNVLKTEQAGKVVVDHCAQIGGNDTCGFGHKVRLPSETSGTLLVFKTYDELSYALVVNVTLPLSTGDHVRNP